MLKTYVASLMAIVTIAIYARYGAAWSVLAGVCHVAAIWLFTEREGSCKP